MVARLRLIEYALEDSLVNRMCNVRACWLALDALVHAKAGHSPDSYLVTKWFYSTRLETRTKESNTCASSWALKLVCIMKVTTEMFASAADRSIGRGLSMSIFVRTRKMVNYACEGRSLGKLRWRLVAITQGYCWICCYGECGASPVPALHWRARNEVE